MVIQYTLGMDLVILHLLTYAQVYSYYNVPVMLYTKALSFFAFLLVENASGKLLGCFLGKCSGSIRSIARHPDLPVIASCGLDSYLRLWDIKSRQLLSTVFLKQHLTNVVFDSHFDDEGSLATLQSEEKVDNEPVEGDEESPPVDKQNKKKRSKSRSLDENKEVTPKKVQKLDGEDGCSQSAKAKRAKKSQNLEDEELISAEQEKQKKSKVRSKNGKSKKAKGESIYV
ncbi:hypothetical protein R6Q59_031853 [Mikania micrantha]